MSIQQFRKDYKTALSTNFKVNEFACRGKGCCSTILIDSELVDYLQNIRDHFGKPVTINSGYRCAKHNANVDGAKQSLHMRGMAADIVVKGVANIEVAKYAESIGILGIGLYENFVHIDTRTSKFFWYSSKCEPRTTFGGAVSNFNSKVKEWQKAAIADGFELPSGADGIWGKECETVAKKAICKKYAIGFKNKNLTKIIQKAVGVTVDGKFGKDTKNAVITWQKLMGLTPDGIVGYNTWKRILGK